MYLDAEELGATFRTTEAAVYEWISTAPGAISAMPNPRDHETSIVTTKHPSQQRKSLKAHRRCGPWWETRVGNGVSVGAVHTGALLQGLRSG